MTKGRTKKWGPFRADKDTVRPLYIYIYMGASLNDTFCTYYIMGASLNVARHNFRWIQLVCLVSVLGVAPGSSQTGLSLHSG